MSLPKDTRFPKLLPYLNTTSPQSSNTENRPSTEFEAQSFSIINSEESWDKFRQEARERQITTAAGLKEFLRAKYVNKCPQDSKAVNDEDNKELSIEPTQESYRKPIRGNTEHIMDLYEEPSKRKASNVRLARMTSRLSYSMSALLPQQQLGEINVRENLSRRLSKSLTGIGSSSAPSTLLMKADDIEVNTRETYVNRHIDDEMHSDSVDLLFQKSAIESNYGSDDSSDDDRSNNGSFEYYPIVKPTRSEALERRRSYRNNEDVMRQSLPPCCERFIGIIDDVQDAPMKNNESVACSVSSCVSNSLPPRKTNEERARLHGDNDGEGSHDGLIESLHSCSKTHPPPLSDTLEINKKIVEELERNIRCNSEDHHGIKKSQLAKAANGRIDHPGASCYRNSAPPNYERSLGVPPDHRELDWGANLVRQHSGVSKSLPPKNPHQVTIQAPSTVKKFFDSSFCTRKTSSSTDDVSLFADGSELLVGWGECHDSSDSETAECF